ncbi:MAG: serine protease, partial [Minicystis sp.]
LDALLAVPALGAFAARSGLLDGLRSSAFLRNEFDARKDLELIVDAATAQGRDASGVRPLRVVVDNARRALLPGNARGADRFEQIARRLGDYYGGEAAPARDIGPASPEALSFSGEDARLPLVFLERAIAAGKGVVRLRIERFFNGQASGEDTFGTAWLIAPGILITNHHVVGARDERFEPPATPADFAAQARGAVAWFDYHREGGARIECAQAELLAADATLDYAILALKDPSQIAGRAALTLAKQQPVLGPSTRLNIVQHAGGGPQKYAIRNNFYVETVEGNLLRYLTDTEPGASGSPVTDDSWQVVALHHAARKVEGAAPSTLDVAQPKTARFHNEGVAIHAILQQLAANAPALSATIAAAQGWA